jgi:hypothetical protein
MNSVAANLIIAPQLFRSLGQLASDDKAHVVDFISTLQHDPAHPGLELERANQPQSPDVWSGRASQDLRVILYKDASTWAILYADHQDAAHEWAARREIGRHMVTGALQIVQSVETVREVRKVAEVAQAPPLFVKHSDDYLLSLGVPGSWLPVLRQIRDKDQLLELCADRLPDDVSNRLYSLADGKFVLPPRGAPLHRPLTEAATTREQFYVVTDAAELQAVLAAPMERWIAFLHPSQRRLVERVFNGPAKITGSAGTGKTVVAMHRARHLALKGERVFLTSFGTTLCGNIDRSLRLLCTEAERQRITVATIHEQALELIRLADPGVNPASPSLVAQLLESLRQRHAPQRKASLVRAQWEKAVVLQGVSSWDGYRQCSASRNLSPAQRKGIWKVLDGVLNELARQKLTDWTAIPARARALIEQGAVQSPFTAVIVDEVQDLRPAELRLVRALCARHPGNLLLCGDAGQGIYPGGSALKALGIDVQGRSFRLRINYRTTEQIRRAAARVRGEVTQDPDGGKEVGDDTQSLLRGPRPVLKRYASREEELEAAVSLIKGWLDRGLQAAAIGVLTPTGAGVEAAGRVLSQAQIPWRRISDRADSDAVQLDTMHRAKGLEFKAVLLLQCADHVLLEAAAWHGVDDPADPEDRVAALARGRHLLYVAMTRARDELVVSFSGQLSRFIEPLLGKNGGDRK